MDLFFLCVFLSFLELAYELIYNIHGFLNHHNINVHTFISHWFHVINNIWVCFSLPLCVIESQIISQHIYRRYSRRYKVATINGNFSICQLEMINITKGCFIIIDILIDFFLLLFVFLDYLALAVLCLVPPPLLGALICVR